MLKPFLCSLWLRRSPSEFQVNWRKTGSTGKYNAILRIWNGGRSQVVKAVDCDSTIRGFKSPRSPWLLYRDRSSVSQKSWLLGATTTNKDPSPAAAHRIRLQHWEGLLILLWHTLLEGNSLYINRVWIGIWANTCNIRFRDNFLVTRLEALS